MAWLSELHRLHPFESELALLPVGWGQEKKGPMVSKGWQSHPGFTIEQLQNTQGIRSVGLRTGLFTGPIVAFDFDGETSLELGLLPADVITWHVHRDNDPFRLKLLFRPTPEQINQLPQQVDGSVEFQGKTITAPKRGDAKGEALEVFFAGGRQVIVLGQHPSSGGNYFWPAGFGPEALCAPPDDWWAHAVEIATRFADRCSAEPKRNSTRKDTRRLDPCPICGRHSGRGGSSLWCGATTDGLIFCMPGSTFSAEQKHGALRIGQVIDGYALVARTAIGEGDVLTFKTHQPLPSRRKQHLERLQKLARIAIAAL